MRTALDLPETTAGLWAEFFCCGRTWETMLWLMLHGRVACPNCGKLFEANWMRKLSRGYREVTVDHVSE